MALPRVRVITLNAALGPLDYRVPDGMQIEHGSVVVAPLGPRQLIGVAWEPERVATEEVGDNRLRPLAGLVDVPPIRPALRRLAEWTADYYLSPLAAVLRMILPSSSALAGPKVMIEYRATGVAPARSTPQRTQALAAIEGRQGTVRELAAHADVSDAVMRGLVNAGALERVEVTSDHPFPGPDPDFAPPTLSDEQTAAAASLTAAIGPKGHSDFDPVLLDGVTGSGKTEVYFEAIAEALRQDRQILVLLPEIAQPKRAVKRVRNGSVSAISGSRTRIWRSWRMASAMASK